MKLLVVNPNTSTAVTEVMAAAARRAATPGTEVVAVTASFGAPYIASRREHTVAAHATLVALDTHAGGCDGVVIAAFTDPGLAAAREALPIPVVGIAEAAMVTACLLGGRFAVITIAPRLVPFMRELADGYGLGARLASVRVVEWSARDIVEQPEAVAEALRSLGRAAVAEDGADVLILGGGPLAAVRDRVADGVGVPVLDGVVCAVRQVQLLADLGVRGARAGRAVPGAGGRPREGC